MEMDNGIMGTLVTLATHWAALDADVAVRVSLTESPHLSLSSHVVRTTFNFPQKQIQVFKSAFSGIFDRFSGENSKKNRY